MKELLRNKRYLYISAFTEISNITEHTQQAHYTTSTKLSKVSSSGFRSTRVEFFYLKLLATVRNTKFVFIFLDLTHRSQEHTGLKLCLAPEPMRVTCRLWC